MRTAYRLLAAILISSTAFAKPAVDFAALDRLIQKTKDTTAHQTGTAIAVIQNGQIVYQGYFGYADIENKLRVNRNTAFYIASATKPLMALNTLLQIEKSKLDSNATLTTLFPHMTFADIDANAVSVRDLLTHTSGIDNQPLVWATAFSGIHDAKSRSQLVAQSYRNAQAAHGVFDYSNVGYNIVSVWLDRHFNTPWQMQLERNVFAPLGMTHSSAYISQARRRSWQIAKPYSVLSANKNLPLYLEKSDQTMQAAGGVVASAADLARFLIAELANGKIDGKQILPSAIIKQSQLSQTKTDGVGYEDFQRSGYAWGWYLGAYKGKSMLHHFGGFAGFHAHLSFIPEANIGLVILNNEDFLAGKVSNLIADYVYGQLLHEANNEARVSARFDALWSKAKALDAAVSKQQAALQARQWDLSLPKAAYLGKYTHPLLGDLYVKQIDDQLQISWGRLSAPATAYESKDQARVEFVPNSGQVIAFVVKQDLVIAVEFEGMQFRKAQ